MGWLGNIINDVNKATSKIPGIGVAEKAVNFGSDVIGQGVTDILGSGGINPYGNRYKSVFDLSKGQPGQQDTSQAPDVLAPPVPASTASATGAANPTNDAVTMGLGMFFQQYLAPLLQQQSQTNNALIGQYGTAMNQAMSHALPPGVKDILSASTPQTQGLLQMMNKAGEQQAAGAGPYQQLVQGLGQESSAQQALYDAFTKWANNVALYGGTTGPLSSALTQQLGGPGTLGGQLAGVIGQAGSGQGLIPGMGSSTGAVAGLPAAQQPTQQQPTAATNATSGQTQTGQPITASTITQLQSLTPSEQQQYWNSLTSEQQAAFQQLGYQPGTPTTPTQ